MGDKPAQVTAEINIDLATALAQRPVDEPDDDEEGSAQ